jgi:gliding motility-associated-like protein
MLKTAAIIIIVFSICLPADSQLAPNPYAAAIYYNNFGEGDANLLTIGKPLAAGKTSLKFTQNICPELGAYTIARHSNLAGCYNNSWISMTTDHTPWGVGLGMGMIMKVNPQLPAQVIYVDTVNKSLCPGQEYQFSAAVLNLIDIRTCPNFKHVSKFLLQVESDMGTLLAQNEVDIPFWDPDPIIPWWRASPYSVSFTMPANVARIVIKLIASQSFDACGDAFAVDDIAVTGLGAVVSAAFTNEPLSTIIKSVCFQQQAQISLSGNMAPLYPNAAYQWQQSTDSGKTWMDIPGANQPVYNPSFAVPDTFFFRLSAGDAALIANPNCRTYSNNIEVNVDGPPTGYSINNNSPVCSGHDIKFNITGNEAGYLWTGPNGFSDNSPFPHIFHSKLSDSGTYYVQVFSQGGCVKTDSVHITVIGTDVYATPSDTTVCAGKPVQLNASLGTKYVWTPTTHLNGFNIQKPVANALATTRYIVTVFDNYGCSDTAAALVRIKNAFPLIASINGPEYLCPSYDSIQFKDQSTGNINKWLWNFGNGNLDTNAIPSTQYYNIPSNTNSYSAKLLVSDATGCSDSTTHILKVASNCFIAVPNVFTPNNDGKNDYLYPLNAYKATNLIFSVYNRDGQLVFQTRDWTKKWDGTVRGKPQSEGVYVWTLKYQDEKHKTISLRGTSILVR